MLSDICPTGVTTILAEAGALSDSTHNIALAAEMGDVKMAPRRVTGALPTQHGEPEAEGEAEGVEEEEEAEFQDPRLALLEEYVPEDPEAELHATKTALLYELDIMLRRCKEGMFSDRMDEMKRLFIRKWFYCHDLPAQCRLPGRHIATLLCDESYYDSEYYDS
ncbi:hypothetical protein KIPB_007579 [Kipferlia bialata]|uniref:Uncharacterized protein n=1 Tax=Kipferlia bialata TaxID=797122 RepID=A0A391NSJ0_9EUKA|nr:hypothetical protein KIPB_007579 [Kipferlia bialata]|eukprot:g7579.t1